MQSKRCSKCKIVKPLELFHRDKRVLDGRVSACAECKRAQDRARRVCDDVKEKMRDYRSTDEHKARYNEYRKQRRKSNPKEAQKMRCRELTNYAILTGKLTREPCMHCGTNDRIEAHHEDYNKPYDVWWLCVTCHIAYHVAQRRDAEEQAKLKKAA